MVPYSSLLVGLRSVKQAASFMLAGVPDQEHKGYCFFLEKTAAKSVDVVRLAVCQAGSILHAGRCACSKTQGLLSFLKNAAAKSVDVVGLAVWQASSIFHAGRCA